MRDPDFGKIEKFEVLHGAERIYLYLLGKKQHIWCDFRDISKLLTKPEYLKALNFTTINVGERKKYELGSITISGIVIETPQTTYLLRYCIGDFTNGVLDIDHYFKDGILDLDKFYNLN